MLKNGEVILTLIWTFYTIALSMHAWTIQVRTLASPLMRVDIGVFYCKACGWQKSCTKPSLRALTIWMKFSVRMFRQMVLHGLYLEKENGNVLYHLPEKRVVPVEKQMKRSLFSGTCNCGQMVQKFPGIPVKARKREYLERYYLFSENIPLRWTVPFEFSPELPKIPFKW